MGILAANYFVLRARLAVRNVVRYCVICRRRNFKTIQQKMGQLPAARVTPAPPFSIVGVDFAGPITIRVGKVRKPTKLKAYISVFVCFVTKATHLEPVFRSFYYGFCSCSEKICSTSRISKRYLQ